MSPKSVSGVLERAKRDGLVKNNGVGYELTAKGKHIEMGVATNA
jgi:Mn-dependent DtxR family transcriptional regulator